MIGRQEQTIPMDGSTCVQSVAWYMVTDACVSRMAGLSIVVRIAKVNIQG